MATSIQLVIYVLVAVLIMEIARIRSKKHPMTESDEMGVVFVAVTWPISVPFFITLGAFALCVQALEKSIRWVARKLFTHHD